MIATAASAGMTKPARTVRAKPSTSCAPIRCAAMMPSPLHMPLNVMISVKKTVVAAVRPASAAAPI